MNKTVLFKPIQYYSILAFFIPFSMLFFTMVLPLSPFHFGLAISIIFVISFILLKHNLSIFLCSKDDIGVVYCILSMILIIILHILFPNQNVSNLSITTPIMVIISYCCYLFSFFIRKAYSVDIKKSFKVFKNITLLILIIECIYRFTHVVRQSSSFNFYEYKFGSFMYSDTNYVGILIAFYIGFICYLRDRKIILVSKLEILISCVLCFLTFSRAAIIAIFVLFSYWYLYRKMNKSLKLITLAFVLFLIPVVFVILINDESFVTKIDLYVQTLKYIVTIDSFHLLYGNGIGSTTLFLSRYGHTILTLYLIEEGVIGLLLLFLFLILNCFKAKKTLFLILPFLLIGFSYMANVIPYFYLLLGIIYNIELNRKDLIGDIKYDKKNEGQHFKSFLVYNGFN